MQFRFWYIIAFIAIGVGAFSIATHPSYKLSLQAKYFYYMGDYKEAQEIATEAFKLDKYNRMASTIMTQSQASLKFINYINDAKKYMQSINELSAKTTVTKADQARVKLMCEIMIDSYDKIPSSVVIDTALVKEAKDYHELFEKLYEEISSAS